MPISLKIKFLIEISNTCGKTISALVKHLAVAQVFSPTSRRQLEPSGLLPEIAKVLAENQVHLTPSIFIFFHCKYINWLIWSSATHYKHFIVSNCSAIASLQMIYSTLFSELRSILVVPLWNCNFLLSVSPSLSSKMWVILWAPYHHSSF